MQKTLVLALVAFSLSCSKPNDPNPDPDPGGGGGNPTSTLSIKEIGPDNADPNTIMVIINGTGFNNTIANNEVLLDNIQAIIKTASITQLVIQLPPAIVEGVYDITVKANGKSVTKTDALRYATGPLEITGFSPDQAYQNTTTLTITGRGFARLPSNNEVLIGNLPATVTHAQSNLLEVNLPANITTGLYSVTIKANGKTVTKVNALHYDDTEVTTLAGSGVSGTGDGLGNQAQFVLPVGITADAAQNLFVADMHRIRKITPAGQVTTYAGSGQRGTDDGNAATARFNTPTAIAADQAGNLYVADQSNNAIRKISTNGIVSTVAGNPVAGNNNGIGTNASFKHPYGVAVNPQGTVLYVADNANHLIRKIDLLTNEVSNYAGTGSNLSTDGKASEAGIPWPGGLHLAADGTLYITEKGAGRIRKISPSGQVSTIGGFLSTLTLPVHIVADKDENTYVVYKSGNQIKKYTKAGTESVIFGSGLSGDTNGPAIQSSFFFPEGIALIESPDGKKTFYIADSGNKKIKKIVVNK